MGYPATGQLTDYERTLLVVVLSPRDRGWWDDHAAGGGKPDGNEGPADQLAR